MHGYTGVDELPDYRRIRAGLYVDGVNAAYQVRGQQISSLALPDFVREEISEDLEVRHSIPALQKMVRSAEEHDEPIRLAPPSAPLLMQYLSQHSNYGITALYWSLNASTVGEITERVCTDVIAMVNEIRAAIGPDHILPSSDIVAQAVEVVVHGNANRIILKDVTQGRDSSPIGHDEGTSRLRNVWWIAGILGTIGSLVFGYIQIMD